MVLGASWMCRSRPVVRGTVESGVSEYLGRISHPPTWAGSSGTVSLTGCIYTPSPVSGRGPVDDGACCGLATT